MPSSASGRSRAVAAVGALALATACSSFVLDGPQVETRFTLDGGAPVDAGVTTRDGGLLAGSACALLNTQRCDYLVRCGLVSVANQQTCIEHLEATWCGPSTWPLHVASGALRFDPVAAAACGASFSTRACSDFTTLPAACQAIVEPNAGLGAACFDGFDDCLEGVCRGAVCPRRCQAPGVAGEVCALDRDCASGLFCRLSTTTLGVGQCAAFAQAQEACDDFTRCLDGLWCTGGSCRVLPTEGQPCLAGRCDTTATCANAPADGGVCVARRGVESLCGTSEQCLNGLGCLNGLCRPLALADAGACVRGQTCPSTLTCVGASPVGPGSCTAPLRAGGACAFDDECGADLACLPADGGRACAPRLVAAGACTSSRDCQVDALCLQGACARLPTVSEPCAATRACLGGVCQPSALAANVFICLPPLAPGSSCSLDDECASGRCVQGACLTACTP
jgi:hypothetical protein